jgi:predicted metal-dependent peptidase
MAAMTNLNLEYNHIGPEGAKALAPALEVRSDHCILLYFTHLTDDVCIYFPKQVMAVMTNLDLSHNSLDAEAAKALVPALKVCFHHL